MANSRDFTGKNRKFTGTKGIITPKGTTGQRVGGESGELRFNTTTELMEYYDGNAWKPIDAPPTISSVSTSDTVGTNTILRADGSSLFTITITGGNFSIGPTVKFIGSTGTEYTPGNINRVSASSITCTTLITMGTTDDPYDVRVTNTSSLSATLDDAFSFNAAPVFTNASGQLGTVYNGQAITGTTLNAGATDAEGNTITFSIISGALPGTGLTLSSSTGAITGTLASTPSLGNYSFIVRAATTEGNAERQFSIQVIAEPFSATGGTITTVDGYKYHTFNSSSNFVTSGAETKSVEYLVVAGGGGGGRYGGGGGAGGFRAIATTITGANTLGVTVGGGGAGHPDDAQSGGNGGNGVNSVFNSITSTGGGGGGNYGNPNSGSAGAAGGSGGGAGTNGQGSPSLAGGTGTVGQGNNGGGAGRGPGDDHGGGGGGAGGVGVNGNSTGVGGNGSTWLNGTTYAGGGTGSQKSSNTAGGTGGGGTGLTSSVAWISAVDGVTNTGGGGGGTRDNSPPYRAGNGGSGVVIIRYLV